MSTTRMEISLPPASRSSSATRTTLLTAMLALAVVTTAGCATVDVGPAAPSPVQTVAQGEIVIPHSLDEWQIARYQAAVAAAGSRARVVDGPVTAQSVVALGGPVPGAAVVVMPDPTQAGRLLAQAVLGCLAEGGLVRGPVALVNLPEGVGGPVAEVLAAAGFTPMSDGEDPAEWYRRRDGDVVAMLTGTDESAAQAIAALDANAQAGKVAVAALGVGPSLPARLAQGVQCAAVRPAFRKEARRAVEAAAGILTGTGVAAESTGEPEVLLVPSVLVRPGLDEAD